MSDGKSPIKTETTVSSSKFNVNHTFVLKISYVFALIFFGLIFLDPNKLLQQEKILEGSVAMVVEKSNDVKVKHPKGATWSTLKAGDKLYPNSMVFTGPGARVMMALEDNSIINQGPDSLLRLKIVKKFKEKNNTTDDVKSAIGFLNSLDKKLVDEGNFDKNDGLDLEIDGGNISVTASESSQIKSIRTRDSNLKLDGASEINIQNDGSNDTKVAMISGNATLSAGSGKLNGIRLKENDIISTKKIKEGDPDNPEKAIESAKSVSSNLYSSFGEKYEIQKKSVWDTIRKLIRVILFMD